MEKITNEMIEQFYELLVNLNTKEECSVLMEDLLTKQELSKLSQRVEAARLLLAGNTYEQVIKQTNISSATLSRVSNCCKYGRGYRNSELLNDK